MILCTMDNTGERQGCRFPDWVPARYVFAILGSMGMAIVYGLKVNLSVCIVAMINNTALLEMSGGHGGGHGEDMLMSNLTVSSGGGDMTVKCEYPEDPNVGGGGGGFQDGPFAWSERVQGLILGSYFWGYLVTQMPGGRVAEMFSARWVFWGAVILNAACTVLTPPAAFLGYGALIAMRVLEGLGAGVTFPAMHVLIARWTPPVERSRMSSIIYAGTALGTVVSLPLSGIIAGSLGWEVVFYGMGGLSLIWCVAWPLLVFDSPESHPLISPVERDMIINSLGGSTKPSSPSKKHKMMKVPWRAVLTSGPFLAIVVAHMCSNFGWYMLLIELPSYMKQVLRFDIQQNAGLSALPFFTMWLFSIILSNRLDWARGKEYLSVTTVRKLATAIGSVIPGICLVGVCIAGCNRAGAVSLMQSLSQWQIIFLTTVGLYAIEVVVYLALASGEVQPWNNPPEAEKGTPEECELALQAPVNGETNSPSHQDKQ
ncbi:hypothetical protein B566_EDAN011978 [Ephemera danica]|nr:hypothetical protein B566_EDAN011978 [Ephemera danica]